MPSILITTSRRTSNRVRSFARDLWLVLPEAERFNRGSMGIEELTSRIRQSGARAALVISIWKGNPGELTFLSTSGEMFFRIRIDSALLRREINPSFKQRLNGAHNISVKSGSSIKTINFAQEFASIFELPLQVYPSPKSISSETNRIVLWFEDTVDGKTLWTHYTSSDAIEIGPRIRISNIWRSTQNE